MDLGQLRTFRAVARHEHVTRAATELNVAQPAVSRAVARLEAELGVPLFDRNGRRVRLNAFGRALLGRTERIFAELEEGRRELADLATPDRGTVALAAETLLALPEVIRAFRARYPDVRFQLVQASIPEMRVLLGRGEVDLCVASVPVDGPGIVSAPLRTEELYVAVPPLHPLAARRQVRLIEAADEPFVSVRPGYGWRDLTDAFCHEAGFAPRVVCESDEVGAARALISAGVGIGFLPAAARRAGGAPAVAWLRVVAPRCERTLRLAWRVDRYVPAAAQRFREAVIAHFAHGM